MQLLLAKKHHNSYSLFFLGIDFIMVSGGDRRTGNYLSSLSLIPLEATGAQASSCSPPGNMLTGKLGHILGNSGGCLIVCGGHVARNVGSKKCEVYNKAQGSGWVNSANMLAANKRYAPKVQLDMNRIWIGRK